MVICSKGCPLGHGQLRGCLRGSTVTLREAEPAWVQTLEVGDAFTSMYFNESHIGNVCIYICTEQVEELVGMQNGMLSKSLKSYIKKYGEVYLDLFGNASRVSQSGEPWGPEEAPGTGGGGVERDAELDTCLAAARSRPATCLWRHGKVTR